MFSKLLMHLLAAISRKVPAGQVGVQYVWNRYREVTHEVHSEFVGPVQLAHTEAHAK